MWNSSVKIPKETAKTKVDKDGFETEEVSYLEGIPANFKDATDNQKMIGNQSGYTADVTVEIAECNYNGESHLVNEANGERYDIKRTFKKDKSMSIFLTCERRKKVGNFEVYGMEELEKQLFTLAENAEEIAMEAVNAAVPILQKSMKRSVAGAAGKGYATGDLEESIRSTGAKTNQYGCFAAVTAKGKDQKGVRNGEKLAYLHYGTSRQQGTGCVTKAVNAAEGECLKEMQQVINKRVKKK